MSVQHTPEFLSHFRQSYGHGFYQVKPHLERCAKSVWSNNNYAQCQRKNGHGLDGAFCKQHDPVLRQQKAEASYAAYRAEVDARVAAKQFASACEAAIRQISEGHNDPRGLALSIIERFQK
jgi:hypothetical protein